MAKRKKLTSEQARDYISGYSEYFDPEEYHRKHLEMLIKSAENAISETSEDDVLRQNNLVRTMEKWLANNAQYKYMKEYAKLNEIVSGYKSTVKKT